MIVLCAWCEQEGRQALMYEIAPHDQPLQSHGICDTHELKLRLRLRKAGRTAHVRPAGFSLSGDRGSAVSINHGMHL